VRGPAKFASYLAALIVLSGFALVGLAWYSVAGQSRLQNQFPYLLSGGLGGLGLIVTGMAVLLMQTLREESAREREQLNEVHVAILRVILAAPARTDRDP
jgi:hypothetical protein